jgi:hypothetical protein
MIKETMPDGTEITEYNCPVCKAPLYSAPDPLTGIRSGGYTVWCGQPNEVCRAQDVSGHGKNVKEAYQIIKEKFIARKDR